jgi:hypothetical protein
LETFDYLIKKIVIKLPKYMLNNLPEDIVRQIVLILDIKELDNLYKIKLFHKVLNDHYTLQLLSSKYNIPHTDNYINFANTYDYHYPSLKAEWKYGTKHVVKQTGYHCDFYWINYYLQHTCDKLKKTAMIGLIKGHHFTYGKSFFDDHQLANINDIKKFFRLSVKYGDLAFVKFFAKYVQYSGHAIPLFSGVIKDYGKYSDINHWLCNSLDSYLANWTRSFIYRFNDVIYGVAKALGPIEAISLINKYATGPNDNSGFIGYYGGLHYWLSDDAFVKEIISTEYIVDKGDLSSVLSYINISNKHDLIKNLREYYYINVTNL